MTIKKSTPKILFEIVATITFTYAMSWFASQIIPAIIEIVYIETHRSICIPLRSNCENRLDLMLPFTMAFSFYGTFLFILFKNYQARH